MASSPFKRHPGCSLYVLCLEVYRPTVIFLKIFSPLLQISFQRHCLTRKPSVSSLVYAEESRIFSLPLLLKTEKTEFFYILTEVLQCLINPWSCPPDILFGVLLLVIFSSWWCIVRTYLTDCFKRLECFITLKKIIQEETFWLIFKKDY